MLKTCSNKNRQNCKENDIDILKNISFFRKFQLTSEFKPLRRYGSIIVNKFGLEKKRENSPILFFCIFFWRARVCRPLLRLCRPFMIFEGCLDSNPEYCRNKLARYRLSHPSHWATHPTKPNINEDISLLLYLLFILWMWGFPWEDTQAKSITALHTLGRKDFLKLKFS